MYLLLSPPSIAVLAWEGFSPTANTAFDSAFVVPSGGDKGSAEVPAAATTVAQRALPPTSTSQGEDLAVISLIRTRLLLRRLATARL